MNDSEEHQFKTHIEMWKHYDVLRQAKNSGFLTANSILVAITGFLFKEPNTVTLIRLISSVGLAVCISWFLLLTRNSAYIRYHREQAGGGDKKFWTPSNAGVFPSRWLDRIPAVAFFVFWGGVLVFLAYTR